MKYFKLFSDCILVKGARRGTICDIQRNKIKFVPNGLIDLFSIYDGKSMDEAIEAYGIREKETIEEYYSFMIENEFGFFCDNPDLFTSFDKLWETPSVIENGIVDYNNESNHNVRKIIKEYSDLGCKHLQFRFYNSPNIELLLLILDTATKSRVNSIELIVKYSPFLNLIELDKMKKNYAKVSSIHIHSVPKKKHREIKVSDIYLTEEKIESSSHCGNISPNYFVVNRETYLESLHFNSCLNKKISIDVKGKIKNCPTLEKSYGNINENSLLDCLNKAGFTDLWKITKNDIEVCKDCEFRFVCTDCRAFVDNKKSKPKKCNYDPYKMIWVS